MKLTSLTVLAFMDFIGLISICALANPDGFLSISCGASNNKTIGGLDWITDSLFINFRNTSTPSPLVPDNFSYQYQSVAYFTNEESSKYCYLLPVTPPIHYLIRATFSHRGFESLPLARVFELFIEGIKWRKVDTRNEANDSVSNHEIIFAPKSESLSLCLARNSETENGHYVFISTIELRPLESQMYNYKNRTDLDNNALVMLSRSNFGGSNIVRYPDDPVDRIWSPFTMSSTTNVSTNSYMPKGPWNKPPPSVLQTAIASQVGYDLLISSGLGNVLYNGSCYYSFYFVNINRTFPTNKSTFQLFIGDAGVIELYYPSFLSSWGYFWILPVTTVDSISIRLHPKEGSDMGPFINAAEVYQMVDINNTTDAGDILAVRQIAEAANFPHDWTAGDPCLPAGFPLTGIICNEKSPARVTILNLTSMGLTGYIPQSIAKLTELTQLLLGNNDLSGTIPDLSPLKNLKTLHLQNNQLSGDIPSSLEKLPMLNELFLQNNKLDGAVPTGLIKPGLNLRVDPQNQISLASTANKNTKEKWIIGLTIGCSVLLIVVIFGIFLWRRKYNRIGLTANSATTQPSNADKDGPNEFQRLVVEYTEEDIKAATDNYSTVIGKGGFGSVFYGHFSGNDVAVKILSTDSSQGKQEFRNEVSLLSRVHHKNLVILIGYCRQPIAALVYEYLEYGTLTDHLHGTAKQERPLDWQTRLNIALQAAEGLLYLHEGCSPPIIHRDIKCTNILLDKRMSAKITDFGLSKLLQDSRSHVSTEVKGTLGYLDPEYYGTSSLNEKSDVYSFGVVLLEIISGVPPKEGLVESAKNLVSCGRIADLMDSSLGGRYSLESAWKVAEIAYTCVEPRRVNRPTMNTVVKELAEAKALVLHHDVKPASLNVLDEEPEPR